MPLLTQKPWFGPRRFGWGWSPYAWQGWLVTVVCLAAIIVGGEFLHGTAKIVAVIVAVLVFLAICAVTGTKPGWRR
jgi:hypothetical protein